MLENLYQWPEFLAIERDKGVEYPPIIEAIVVWMPYCRPKFSQIRISIALLAYLNLFIENCILDVGMPGSSSFAGVAN